jgi:hypothetical protein
MDIGLRHVFERIAAVVDAERWSYIPSGEKPLEIKYHLPSPFQPLIVPMFSYDPHGSRVANMHPEYGLRSIAYLPFLRKKEHHGYLQLVNFGNRVMEVEIIVQIGFLQDYAGGLVAE